MEVVLFSTSAFLNVLRLALQPQTLEKRWQVYMLL